ncbi:MAG: NlpC/P60 family protein [Gammaproteobacteria bacterium]
MILRRAILRETTTWLGTPWHHQGRIKANTQFKGGVDCAGLIIAIGNQFNVLSEAHFDYRAYGQELQQNFLRKQFEKYLIPVDNPQGGDILLLLIGQKIQHAGLLTFSNTLIHACSQAGCVIESRLTDKFWQRVVGTYRYPRLSMSPEHT